MKNICFFNTIPTWGGGEKWHYEMANYAAILNYNVFFFTKKGGVLDTKIQNTEIHKEYITNKNLSYLKLKKVKQVAKKLKEFKVDIIILNASQDLKLGGLAANKAGVKNIIYRRGSAIPIKNTFINRYFFSNIVTNIIANSEATKNTINQNKNLFPKDKIQVIPNGIATKNFLDDDTKIYIKDKESFVLGNLGRLVKQKNQFFLLEVAKELKSKNINFKLLIGGEGGLKEALLKKRKEYQLEAEVYFVGFVNHPKIFLKQIDIFLLSSLWEGFGYVIAEAMLCEKPVIAFNVSSNPELIVDNENGFLTKVNDVNAFVNKILLLKKEKNTLKKMGTSGKNKIITEFDESVARHKFISFIESL